MLRVDIQKQLGEFSLAAAFASEGRVTGLFGASGSGKTSLINTIAGLLRPDRGTIMIDGETVDDTASGIHVPTWRRRIGYVFQDARLFPHLDIRQNLDYGRRKLEILPYLVRLRDEAGVPMVYVSHDAAELRQLATQIVMLRRGQVTAFGGVKVLTAGG